MSHERRAVLLAAAVAVLVAAVGCRRFDYARYEAGRSAGGYTVQVQSAATGRGIPEAVIEWNYYFASEVVDPAQRPNWGVCLTGADGRAAIPGAEHPMGDFFQELNVRVTVAGYHEGRQTVKARSGMIVFSLKPIERTGLQPEP